MRLAVWPSRLPLPERLVPGYRWLCYRERVLVLVPDTEREPAIREPSGETYLQLANVDLDDLDAVQDFASLHGVIKAQPVAKRGAAGVWVGVGAWRIESNVAELVPEPVDLPPGISHDLGGSKLDAEYFTLKRERVEALYSFQLGARLARDLTGAWRVLREGFDPRKLTWELPRYGGEHIRTPEEAARFIEAVLDAGLQTFHPRVRVIGHLKSTYEGSQIDEAPIWPRNIFADATVERGLFGTICIELFNHILENARYRRCANKNCARLFVRQQGRAKKGQNRVRGGVKYCSARCAEHSRSAMSGGSVRKARGRLLEGPHPQTRQRLRGCR